MKSALRRARSIIGLAARVPLLVKAGTLCGTVAGFTIGLMVSAPIGILFGLSLGASVGIVAGIVMDRDDKRSDRRTRELDDIIGVTSGSLGAPPNMEREKELKSWATEWLTPPPPHVG